MASPQTPLPTPQNALPTYQRAAVVRALDRVDASDGAHRLLGEIRRRCRRGSPVCEVPPAVLARAVRISERTARRRIAELVRAGVLEREIIPDPGGGSARVLRLVSCPPVARSGRSDNLSMRERDSVNDREAPQGSEKPEPSGSVRAVAAEIRERAGTSIYRDWLVARLRERLARYREAPATALERLRLDVARLLRYAARAADPARYVVAALRRGDWRSIAAPGSEAARVAERGRGAERPVERGGRSGLQTPPPTEKSPERLRWERALEHARACGGLTGALGRQLAKLLATPPRTPQGFADQAVAIECAVLAAS